MVYTNIQHPHVSTSSQVYGVQGVSVKAVPETVVLQRPGEEMAALMNVPAEQLLLRWVAHHIGAAGPAWEAWLPLKDLGPDLADSTALYCLLSQLEAPDLHAIDLRCVPLSLPLPAAPLLHPLRPLAHMMLGGLQLYCTLRWLSDTLSGWAPQLLRLLGQHWQTRKMSENKAELPAVCTTPSDPQSEVQSGGKGHQGLQPGRLAAPAVAGGLEKGAAV